MSAAISPNLSAALIPFVGLEAAGASAGLLVQADARLVEETARLRESVPSGIEFTPPGGSPLTLFVPHHIWAPGNWTTTLVEGLLASGNPRFRGKVGIELGTGSGVIAISLIRAGAARMLGLDLNPNSPPVASLNAYWNLPPEHQDDVFFAQSDLLAALRPEFQCDFVVGCLPQVVCETKEIETTRHLGDVYAGTGETEDLFGLGLLARALRRAHLHLSDGGWVEFVVAGRPGRENLLELFMRRGYHPEIVHQKRIPQDSDPPMKAFVEMERLSGIRFEFYVPDHEGPVSATVAAGYPPADISHDLYVIRGVPYPALERMAVDHALIGSSGLVGYTEDPGTELPALRTEIARHYSNATGIGVNPDLIYIGPSVQELFRNIAEATTIPVSTILYSDRNWERFSPARGILSSRTQVRTSDDLNEIAAAMEARSPKLVIFNLTHRDRDNHDGLKRIAEIALRKGIRVVTAGIFHRHSSDDRYPLARLFGEMPEMVGQWVVLNDLSRRLSLSEAHISYAIIPDRLLYRALVSLGEVRYSRVSTIGQEAATKVLRQVRRPSSRPTEVSLDPVAGSLSLNRSLPSQSFYPSLRERPPSRHPDPIRMEFGQSERPVPPSLVEEVRQILGDPPSRNLEREAIEAAATYLKESRGIEGVEIIAGPGVLPLQAAAMNALSRRAYGRIPVFLPRPSYDVHFAMQAAAGGFSIRLQSDRTRVISSHLGLKGRRDEPQVLILTQPTNPGGQFYSEEELIALSRAAPELTVFSDEVFGLLGSDDSPLVSPAALGAKGSMWSQVLTFFGISKEIGEAGGFRGGFVATSDREMADAIRRELLTPADPVALAASIAYFKNWRETVEGHRSYLRKKRGEWEGALRSVGLPYLPSQGGYGTLVDFSPLYGRGFRGRTVTRENLAILLHEGAGLIVHAPGWGDTEMVRTIYSVERLTEAVERLHRFLGELAG